MPLPELRMSFADRAALEHEVASNLRHGRAFVPDGQGVEVLGDCVLVLVSVQDATELALSGQAVFVSDAPTMRGIGVQLRPFDAQLVAKLEAFARGERVIPSIGEVAAGTGAAAAAAGAEARDDGAAEVAAIGEADPDADLEAVPGGETEADPDALEGVQAQDDGELADDVQAQPARHERLRKLNQTQQHKMARSGDLNDRIMLERIYGKGVWDSLLHNPKLTLPEVARIARKGTIPRPLLELIVDNNGWIQAPIVRRALLTNPRMSSEGIMKLLRLTPKHELKGIYKTTTYSTQVREAARKVLDL
jgi:Tfp pilus assembly protein PilZ